LHLRHEMDLPVATTPCQPKSAQLNSSQPVKPRSRVRMCEAEGKRPISGHYSFSTQCYLRRVHGSTRRVSGDRDDHSAFRTPHSEFLDVGCSMFDVGCWIAGRRRLYPRLHHALPGGAGAGRRGEAALRHPPPPARGRTRRHRPQGPRRSQPLGIRLVNRKS